MSEPATSSATLPRTRHPAIAALLRWIDTSQAEVAVGGDDGIDWLRVAPFIAMHLACVGVLWVGVSATALWIALASYALRMFAITAFYHRYFSHKTFHTSRAMQFLFGLLGASCVQHGPLWWAAHHRHHHRHADTEQDVHSPRHLGFFRSHMGWFMAKGAFRTNEATVPDLAKYPELRWLDRYDVVVPVFYAAGLYALGAWLGRAYPDLGTSGPQLLVWGFFVSTIVLFHVSVSINSLAHQGQPPLRDPGRQPQQCPARATDLRRGLAQQPPPLPGFSAPGRSLVGSRPVLVPAAADVGLRDGLEPQDHARAPA